MKKQITTIGIALLLVLAALFNGCKKEISIAKPGHSALYNNLRSEYENPLDSVGRIHNDILDAIAEIPTFPLETLLTDYNVIVTELVKSYPNDTAMSLLEMQTSTYYVYNNSMTHLIGDLIDSSMITEEQEYFLRKLDTISQITNVSLLQSELGYLVDELVESDLEEKEQEPIFGAAAVLKYSSDFWTDAKNDEHHPWHDVLGNDPPKFRWIKDAMGFIHGFVDEVNNGGGLVNAYTAGCVSALGASSAK